MSNDDSMDIRVCRDLSKVPSRGHETGDGDASLWPLLDCFPRGVFLLDSKGKVSGLNAAAKNLLNGSACIFMDPQRRLRLRNDSGSASIDDLVAAARAVSNQQPSVLSITCRLPKGTDRLDLAAIDLGVAGVAVVVSDRAAQPIISPVALRKLYGLTTMEQRVLAALIAGATPREAANDLGITLNTIRRHLKQIFLKTDVCRQSELVRLITCGPAILCFNASERQVDVPSPPAALLPVSRSAAGPPPAAQPIGALDDRADKDMPRAAGLRMSYKARH